MVRQTLFFGRQLTLKVEGKGPVLHREAMGGAAGLKLNPDTRGFGPDFCRSLECDSC